MSRTRPLVIAVGNPYRADDGVGAAVLETLAATNGTGHPAPDLKELLDGEPTRLIDAWEGRDVVVVVDAIAAAPAAGRKPGQVVVVADVGAGDDEALVRHAAVSSHGAGVAEAVALGAALGRLPRRLSVVGVVISVVDYDDRLSKPVAAAVPKAVRAVLDLCVPARGTD